MNDRIEMTDSAISIVAVPGTSRDADHDEDPDPEDLADPSCVECGGQGGWCGSFTPDGRCIWTWCDCTDMGKRNDRRIPGLRRRMGSVESADGAGRATVASHRKSVHADHH